jgi:hypothetical protein
VGKKIGDETKGEIPIFISIILKQPIGTKVKFTYRTRYVANRDRCYDFKNIFAKKFSKKTWRFWLKTKLNNAKFSSQHSSLRETPIISPKIVEN